MSGDPDLDLWSPRPNIDSEASTGPGRRDACRISLCLGPKSERGQNTWPRLREIGRSRGRDLDLRIRRREIWQGARSVRLSPRNPGPHYGRPWRRWLFPRSAQVSGVCRPGVRRRIASQPRRRWVVRPSAPVLCVCRPGITRAHYAPPPAPLTLTSMGAISRRSPPLCFRATSLPIHSAAVLFAYRRMCLISGPITYEGRCV